MSDDELRHAEGELLAWIAARETPATHDEVIQWAHDASARYSPAVVRRLVWRLVSEDKLAFTGDWQLVPVA